MKQIQIIALLLSILTLNSCTDQNQAKSKLNQTHIPSDSNKDINFDKGLYCALLDRQGVLWFGSRGNGVYRYDGKSFTNFSEQDGLCDNNISSILEDKEGNIWFGTTNGLCRYDKKTFTPIAIPFTDTSSLWLDKVYPIVNPNQVMSLFQDKKGAFWIGTNGAGVYRYDGKRYTQYLSTVGMVYEDGLQHNIVLSITEDLSENIWFTSLSHAGVSRYDGETFTHFLEEDGLSDDFIRTSYCDQSGNIWIGTHGNHKGGLDRFDGKTFTHFHKEEGLSSNNVQGIYQDKTGVLWFGSGIGNLCVYDGKNFKEITNKQGQKFSPIQFILEDRNHNIWFGGTSGLWKVDGNTIKDMTVKNNR